MLLYPKLATSPLYKTILQEKRVLAGFSQADLAEQSGLTAKTINRMETPSFSDEGRMRGFYLQSAQAVAAALGEESLAVFFQETPPLSQPPSATEM